MHKLLLIINIFFHNLLIAYMYIFHSDENLQAKFKLLNDFQSDICIKIFLTFFFNIF